MIEFKKHIHYSQELEQAILGACLIEKLAFGRTYGIVKEENFYFDCHKRVYLAINELYEKSLPIDILTVVDVLTRKGVAELQGYNTPYFVTQLTNAVVSSAHVEYHCHLIKEMWARRKIIEIKYKPIDDESDTDGTIDDLNKQINGIISGKIKHDWYSMDQIMFDLMIHQMDMAKGKKEFLTTGFNKLDEMNGGFFNGQMVVIGARPSVGKSAFMGQMALSMAHKGKTVGIISLEMNNTEIAARLAAIETNIDFMTIFRTIARDEELHKKFYDKISKETIHLPIFLSDKTKVNVNEIRAKAMKLKASKGCDCLIVDYLQLVDSHTTTKNSNREQDVAQMSRGLKLMAQELEIPVIVLCQLNREVAKDSKRRLPRLSDLRESGAIEQDADIVMFIHRDWPAGWTVDETGNSTEYDADLVVAKWRNGSTCHLKLDFDPPKMKFSERKGFIPAKIDTRDFTEPKREDPF